MLLGKTRQRRGRCRRQRSRTAHIDIEAALGRGHLDVERLAHRRRASRRSPRPPAIAPSSARRQHRTAVDGDDADARAARRSRPSSTSRWLRRAWSTARRRPSPWASIRSSTGAVEAGLRQRRRRRGRASSRDSARPPNAGVRSRRKCRNADRSARCAPALGVSTLIGMRADRDGPARLGLDGLARQRERNVTPARPAYRQCRRRAVRDGQSSGRSIMACA